MWLNNYHVFGKCDICLKSKLILRVDYFTSIVNPCLGGTTQNHFTKIQEKGGHSLI
jgi:hypothetical protein